MRGVVTTAALAARETGLDPEWPPVLIALVLVVLGACAVSVIVVLRAFRAETRGASARRRTKGARR